MINQKQLSLQFIQETIISFVLENFISEYNADTLPLDQSLIELGVLDSMGVVELISFMENKWSIVIEDSDITTELMGSINKMATLIREKLSKL